MHKQTIEIYEIPNTLEYSRAIRWVLFAADAMMK